MGSREVEWWEKWALILVALGEGEVGWLVWTSLWVE
jgi:hypothetical protein